MQGGNHIRFISLVMALGMVVGGWLLFEYANKPAPVANYKSEAAPTTAPLPEGEPFPSQAAQPSTIQKPLPGNLVTTYKCEKSGRVSYSDTPCAANERVLSVSTSEAVTKAANNNLAQLREKAALMEAERLERDRRYSVTAASLADQAKVNDCQQIDRSIAAKDSELRMPHSPQWGDYLAGERKKLYDRRFSLNC